MKKIDLDNLSIFFDKKNNRYLTKLTIEDGKPRKTVYGKTKQEVIKNVKQLLYKYGNQNYIIREGIPFLELVKYNFSRRDNAGLIGDAQYVRTQRLFKRISQSSIANKNIQKLTEKDYQNFFEELAKEYSQSSFDKFYSEIKQALEYAFRKRIIEEFPLDIKIKPKSIKQTREIKALSIEQQKVLSQYLENASIKDCSYKNALLLQLYMGLRIGEATALSIEDIDLNKKQIYIHKTISTDRNEKPILEEKTKTQAGNRVLPIPDNMLPFLKEQIQIAKNNKRNLLFLNRNNGYVLESSVNGQLKNKLVKLNIYEEGMATHALRHTYATRCIEANIEPIIISKLMGHADINVTLKKYITIFNEQKAQSTKKTDDYYKQLNLLQDKIMEKNIEEKQKITENNNHKKEYSNIIQFPKKYVANNWYDR